MAGRPKKDIAKELDLAQVERLAGLGLTDTEIGIALGVTERSINRYKKNPKFLSALKNGKLQSDMEVVETLFRQAKRGDVTACIFWLKNRRPKDFRDKQDVEHSGSVENRITGFNYIIPEPPKGE